MLGYEIQLLDISSWHRLLHVIVEHITLLASKHIEYLNGAITTAYYHQLLIY